MHNKLSGHHKNFQEVLGQFNQESKQYLQAKSSDRNIVGHLGISHIYRQIHQTHFPELTVLLQEKSFSPFSLLKTL